jgi:hypothetical protein
MDAVDREERFLILEARTRMLEILVMEQASIIKRLLDNDAKAVDWIAKVKEILGSVEERITEAREKLR